MTLVSNSSIIRVTPTELSHVGSYTLQFKGCLKLEPTVCTIGRPQTVTVQNPCLADTLAGPNFKDFSALVGDTAQMAITLTSIYEICEGLEKYDVTLETELDPGWPFISITDDGTHLEVNPTSLDHLGTFTVQLKACLKMSPTVCSIGSAASV